MDLVQLLQGGNRDKIKNAIDEAVKISLSIENRKEEIKDISTLLKDEYQVAPKDFNLVVSTLVKDNLDSQVDKIESLQEVIRTFKGE